MKHIKTYEFFNFFKKNYQKELDNFNKKKNETKPITIISKIDGKKITYNPFDREIINDDNFGKYVVLNEYPFDINDVKIKDKKELISFINNNIGKIITASLGGGATYYDIKYNNVPKNLQQYFTQRKYDINCDYLISIDSDFSFISSDYNDCLNYITTKKYNI